MEDMNMNELRSLAKERNLRGYSRLRKADLINLLHLNVRVSPCSFTVSKVHQNLMYNWNRNSLQEH